MSFSILIERKGSLNRTSVGLKREREAAALYLASLASIEPAWD